MSVTTISSDLKKAALADSRPAGLPVTRDLTLVYAVSLLICLVVAVTAAAGLLFRETVYPTDELILALLPVDAFHLVVGVPVLLGSMWLARRGSLAGLLCWPGALLYVLYSYLTNLTAVPFGVLFVPYLLLVTLSAYTTIGLIASIDGGAVRQRLAAAVPARVAGGVLAGFTALFIVVNLANIVAALASQTADAAGMVPVWIADMTTVGPACLAGGILLLRRKVLGYVGGAGLLLLYSMLFFGLLPCMVFPALYNGSAIDGAGVALMLVCGSACLLLLARFLRGTRPGHSPRSIREGDARP